MVIYDSQLHIMSIVLVSSDTYEIKIANLSIVNFCFEKKKKQLAINNLYT